MRNWATSFYPDSWRRYRFVGSWCSYPAGSSELSRTILSEDPRRWHSKEKFDRIICIPVPRQNSVRPPNQEFTAATDSAGCIIVTIRLPDPDYFFIHHSIYNTPVCVRVSAQEHPVTAESNSRPSSRSGEKEPGHFRRG